VRRLPTLGFHERPETNTMPHADDPAFYRQRAALVAERGYAASAMQAPPK